MLHWTKDLLEVEDLTLKSHINYVIVPRKTLTNMNHILVIGDAAVDDSFLAGVDNNEGKVDDGVGGWRSVCLLLCLSIPLDQVLKGYLL